MQEEQTLSQAGKVGSPDRNELGAFGARKAAVDGAQKRRGRRNRMRMKRPEGSQVWPQIRTETCGLFQGSLLTSMSPMLGIEMVIFFLPTQSLSAQMEVSPSGSTSGLLTPYPIPYLQPRCP